ncbi:hypothetical protein TNCV_4029611 [Trichonephila clavipes]|nr:hypothetical protein TNCV_4029611 [Trichonephila clavipes]
MVQVSGSGDDCSDSDYEEVNTGNSGSDSSVCCLIEDDCSLIETVYIVCSSKSDFKDNKQWSHGHVHWSFHSWVFVKIQVPSMGVVLVLEQLEKP